ncbi:MAG: N-acetylmuramoyl-L-alanine amidase [Myxococcota bacterium]
MSRGYDLPRFGSDGHFGDECWEALQRFAKDQNIDWDPRVPAEVLTALDRPATPPPAPRATPSSRGTTGVGSVKVYDLREQADSPHKKSKTVAGRTVQRRASSIDAITIHQTAVKFGVKSYQISAAGGDRDMALARRAFKVACHALAFHDGFISLAAPLRWYVYHANSLNRRSLGLEIDGNYAGLAGGRTANGRPPTPLTDKVIEASRMAVKLLMEEGRKEGCPIKYIHAHRQSSRSRRGDPGEELWRKVVLEYAVPVLGLQTEPGKTWGNGKPIPKDWDPNGVGEY